MRCISDAMEILLISNKCRLSENETTAVSWKLYYLMISGTVQWKMAQCI